VARQSVRIDLPAAPGSHLAPAPLVLTAPEALALPALLADGGVAGLDTRALATFLAALEYAPAGGVLDVGAGLGLFALVAAAYSPRPVHALEPVADLAHVARQSAATGRLSVVVEQRELTAPRPPASVDLRDGALEHPGGVHEQDRPAVVHIGPAADADLVAAALHACGDLHPWVLWSTATEQDAATAREASAHLPDHRVHVVGAPDGDPVHTVLLTPGDPGPGFWQRCEQWHAVLEPALAPAGARPSALAAVARP
jgi:predicted RNA methylase